MSRVFRIYNNNANQTITDWQDNSANIYSAANSIEKNILDPMVSNVGVSKPITSIPSPFAQIDLVKTAFKIVADSKDLKGQTVYHQLVSNALDIAEIFFNIDKLKDKVEILFWDKKDLNSLSSSAHILVKHVLETYLKDTGYNFEKMDRIFMLNYIGIGRPSSGLNILGGTSPATLFFCSANDLSFASQHISFSDGDKPFDDGIKSLHEREPEFFAYMYALATKNSGLFSELAEYVKLCDQQSSDDQKTANTEAMNNYETLFNDLYVGQNRVSICGISLKKRNIGVMADKASQCDFVIKSSKQSSNLLPLVLPVRNGDMYEGWTYSNGLWNTASQCVPVKDDKPFNNRTLPNDGQQYPYLTMDDFLEKTIIRMGGKYNSAYFDGNFNEKEDFSYLLPLTDTFFEYFTVEDLKGKVAGEPMIEIKLGVSKETVTVTLRIPVKRNNASGYVEYIRQYINSDSCNPEQGTIFPLLDDNKMIDEDEAFMLTLMPRVKFLNESDAQYRVSLLSEKSASYSVKCYSKSGIIDGQSSVVRCEGGNGIYRHEVVAVEKDNIAYIKISAPCGSGIAVPNMIEEQRNGSSFIFAVDFGTSNTHIEYQQDANRVQPFSVLDNDRQVASLPTSIDKLALDMFTKRLDFELMPQMTGQDFHFQFPFRTSLCESNLTNWNDKPIAMADVNIPFVYGKSREFSCNKVRTNLKWINDDRPRERYIESLLFIIRNKVLLNGGDLSQTKIVWSYPLSMKRTALGSLSRTWEELFKKYISSNTGNITRISESVSPYYKHKRLPGTVATIDIGGGTTDVMVAKEGAPQCISSFRYAANDLFSDKTQNNQMIAHYSTIIGEKLSAFTELKDVMDSLQNVQDNRSADLASFFFSLSQNKDITAKTDALNFNRMLEDDEDYKIIFVVFYGAIIYHLARLMKEKNLGFPRNIAFSGNGSKIISVLSSDESNLAIFTKKIFEKVFECGYDKDGLSIIMTDNPKEVTCEGSIEYLKELQADDNSTKKKIDPNELKTVLLPTGICGDDILWSSVNNSETFKAAVKEVKSYMQIIFDLTNGRNLIDELFGVSKESVQLVMENYERDMENYIKSEFDEMNEDGVVNEPIFFFPFKGMLGALQSEITKKKES